MKKRLKRIFSSFLAFVVALTVIQLGASASSYDNTTGRTKTAYCYFCCANKTFYEHHIGYDGYDTCDGYVNGSSWYVYKCGTCNQSEGMQPTQLDSVWGISTSPSYHSVTLTWHGGAVMPQAL